MNIQTTEDDKLIKISISGSANSSELKELDKIVESIINGQEKNVDIDLSELQYIDSTCISILLKLHKNQKLKNLGFRISKASNRVSSLLSLCSLADTLMVEN